MGMNIFTEKISVNDFFMGPVEIKASTLKGAGFGGFAKEKIKKYQLIEKCPVVLFDRWILDLYYKDRECFHLLNDYIFQWPDGKAVAVALGYGSMYNHSDEPNVFWKYTASDIKLAKEGSVTIGSINSIDFYAKRDIDINEELFANYGAQSEYGDPRSAKQKAEDWYSRKLF